MRQKQLHSSERSLGISLLLLYQKNTNTKTEQSGRPKSEKHNSNEAVVVLSVMERSTHDAALHNDQNVAKKGETFKIKKASLALKKLCPGLLTEDAFCNNDCFIEVVVSNSDILISYLDLREKHKQTSVGSRNNIRFV